MATRTKKPPLTETEWARVFRMRCASKRGESISGDDADLFRRAYREDPARYSAMNADVFDAAVPVGSNVKYQRSK